MFSLYRAWFGGGQDNNSYPRLDALSPPDTVIRVGNEGEYRFVAHRSILSAHSGYLKALLAASSSGVGVGVNSGNNGSALSSGNDDNPQQPLVTSITIPSTIGGEAFAPLLNYMYTGHLEVTLDNIYTVLLATHLLHMPGALEQCRAALLRLRAPPTSPQQGAGTSGNNSVLRPVPNRPSGPTTVTSAFCWPHSAIGHLYPTPRHLELLPHHLPTLQLSLPVPISHKLASSYGAKDELRSVSPGSSSSQIEQQQQQQHQLQQDQASDSRSTSPELVVASSSASSVITHKSDDHQQLRLSRPPSPSVSSEKILSSDDKSRQQQRHRNRRRSQQQKRFIHPTIVEKSSSSTSTIDGGNNSLNQTPGVVYDVACCDGPVRFHRVLNENYAPVIAQAQATQRALQCNGNESLSSPTAPTSISLLPINNRENDENKQSIQPTTQSAINNEIIDGTRSYTCEYCQHTFKSQYCYRKHARRHLLPSEKKNDTESPEQSVPHVTTPQLLSQPQTISIPESNKKREVRLLDLNVQYYPCKICGSKFPSYYFVHKHRKLCHANIDEPSSIIINKESSNNDNQSKAKSLQSLTQQQQQQQQPSTSESVMQQQST